MDLGVQVEGYCSDLQRVWYFLRPGELEPPAEVMRAFAAVAGAIQTASGLVRPGVPGWEVDAAARSYLTKAGYPEFPHALGHSVGRSAHDGGTGFYPRWDRYGGKPYGRLAAGGIYTLELGVRSPVGYIGLEEMIAITEDGCEWLSEPQRAPYLVAG
jgi:Xaa-Pro aminopeptidase